MGAILLGMVQAGWNMHETVRPHFNGFTFGFPRRVASDDQQKLRKVVEQLAAEPKAMVAFEHRDSELGQGNLLRPDYQFPRPQLNPVGFRFRMLKQRAGLHNAFNLSSAKSRFNRKSRNWPKSGVLLL